LHAADTPYLVNNAGFIPVGVLGGEGGTLPANRLDIAVPNSSPIKTPADLKGHTLTCTVPSSITGYRAAVALFDAERGPAAQRGLSHHLCGEARRFRSKGLVKNEYEAAALSDDKVQSLIGDEKLKATDFRTISRAK